MTKNHFVLKLAGNTFFCSAFLSLLSLFISTPLSLAKDYTIRSVIIRAQLNSDGSMDIVEKRTYKFRGHFHWATYFLPTVNAGGVIDFAVGEDGKSYERSKSEEVGTYLYQETPQSIEAKWFFDAKDQERTFLLSYRILDVVKIYEDAAVLYYKFVGDGWDKLSKEVKVSILPPKTVNKDKVKAWAHGPLWGTIEILDDGKIIAEVRKLPANTFWEVRAIYPTYLFSDIRNIIPEKIVSQIMQEEKRWAQEANREREKWIKNKESESNRKRYGGLLVLILSLAGFFTCFNLYNRYGKKHKVPFPDTYYSEIPSDISPALLNYLLYYQQIDGKALVGTILDLARRGFLKLKQEKPPEKKSFWSFSKPQYFLELNRDFYEKNKTGLLDFEEDLLNFVFGEISEGKDFLPFKTLEKKRNRFISWFNQWQKNIKEIGKLRGYWEEDSLKARNKSILVSVALFGVTIFSVFFIKIWALLPGIFAFILLVLSFYIPRLRPEFELEAKKWKGLKKYLSKYHFREAGGRFLIENIERFLAYAVVLGLSKKVVKSMLELVPVEEYSRVIPWYIYSGGHADFSPSGLAESLSSLMSSATSTMSSASGTGGGASGGGGGGAGGSGGGAG